MTLVIETELEPQFTPPSKVWRNKWWTPKPFVHRGHYYRSGTEWGTNLFPSKEIAEQRTLEWMRKNAVHICLYRLVYLGPFPYPP